ncbi:HlyD family efflux transporter periplasmic adaptor subunit [Apilactobacillus micheneri]|uniref:HlyD family efflux transporter periplasmic adaptor subunit n=1 Tax=Apilactobacillus micheneri TaxID=1899430 RepID=UPI001128CB5A|nr:HlyD family efflux transporter periplasmic adaptor subunit [Apilactobacillus micheneri]TPR42352.1 HlyD family efflux transporter periplasmic adaptor subunit [Apilactobacillus micheneri]TPR47073.1 HlyD family efflux transporter periplasmic adaptor subunit [Apilactobacillus micheneri]
MNKELFESTEFYNKRYQNFSTIIIIPLFVLLLGIMAFMFIGKMDITVNSSGTIMPVNKVINVTNDQKISIVKQPYNNEMIRKNQTLIKYENGEKIKSPINGIFYKNNSEKNLGSIYPTINTKNKLMTKVYVTGKDIGSIKKGQTVTMTLPNNKQNNLVKGYVKDYSSLPETYKGNSYYAVTCYLNPNKNDIKNVFYGMNGKININTSKVSIAKYVKNLFN